MSWHWRVGGDATHEVGVLPGSMLEPRDRPQGVGGLIGADSVGDADPLSSAPGTTVTTPASMTKVPAGGAGGSCQDTAPLLAHTGLECLVMLPPNTPVSPRPWLPGQACTPHCCPSRVGALGPGVSSGAESHKPGKQSCD